MPDLYAIAESLNLSPEEADLLVDAFRAERQRGHEAGAEQTVAVLKALSSLNGSTKDVLGLVRKATNWDESDHARDHGKFSSKPGAKASADDPPPQGDDDPDTDTDTDDTDLYDAPADDPSGALAAALIEAISGAVENGADPEAVAEKFRALIDDPELAQHVADGTHTVGKALISVDDRRNYDWHDPAPYGFCPECREAGIGCERRPNGNAHCANGHVYPRSKAKYASTQIELTGRAAAKLRAMAARIADADLGEDGREDEPHVTARYGLHIDRPEPIAATVSGFGPVRLTVGALEAFRGAESGKDYDVIYAEVNSPDLVRLNEELSALPHTDTHAVYRPHATVAYVKAGLADKYLAALGSVDEDATIGSLTFSTAKREKTRIPLTHTVAKAFDPNEKRDAGGKWTAGGGGAKAEGGEPSPAPKPNKNTIARLPETEDEAVALATAARDAIIGSDEGDCAVDGDCERASWLMRAVHPDVEIWHGEYNGEYGHNIVKAGEWFIDLTSDQFEGGDPIRVWSEEDQEKGVLGQYPEYAGFYRSKAGEQIADEMRLSGAGVVGELENYQHTAGMLGGGLVDTARPPNRKAFDPNQQRDELGHWSSTGASHKDTYSRKEPLSTKHSDHELAARFDDHIAQFDAHNDGLRDKLEELGASRSQLAKFDSEMYRARDLIESHQRAVTNARRKAHDSIEERKRAEHRAWKHAANEPAEGDELRAGWQRRSDAHAGRVAAAHDAAREAHRTWADAHTEYADKAFTRAEQIVGAAVDAIRSQLGLPARKAIFKAWSSDKHPRDKNGRFISKDAMQEAKSDPKKAAELRKRVKPEDAGKLESVLSGDEDPGRTKRGQAEHEAGQRRKTREESKARANELIRKISTGQLLPITSPFTPSDLHALADHLPHMTVADLRRARMALHASFGGDRKKEQMISRLKAHAMGAAEEMINEGIAAQYAELQPGGLFSGARQRALNKEPDPSPLPGKTGWNEPEAKVEEENPVGDVSDYLDASKYPTRQGYIDAEVERLRGILPDDSEEVLQAQAEMWANDRWKAPPEKGKYSVGDTVEVGGDLYSFRGSHRSEKDGKVYAVVAGKGGQFPVVEGGLYRRPVRVLHLSEFARRCLGAPARHEPLQMFLAAFCPRLLVRFAGVHFGHFEIAGVHLVHFNNKPVPAEVLADYPDLAAKYGTPAPKPPTAPQKLSERSFTGRADDAAPTDEEFAAAAGAGKPAAESSRASATGPAGEGATTVNVSEYNSVRPVDLTTGKYADKVGGPAHQIPHGGAAVLRTSPYREPVVRVPYPAPDGTAAHRDVPEGAFTALHKKIVAAGLDPAEHLPAALAAGHGTDRKSNDRVDDYLAARSPAPPGDPVAAVRPTAEPDESPEPEHVGTHAASGLSFAVGADGTVHVTGGTRHHAAALKRAGFKFVRGSDEGLGADAPMRPGYRESEPYWAGTLEHAVNLDVPRAHDIPGILGVTTKRRVSGGIIVTGRKNESAAGGKSSDNP